MDHPLKRRALETAAVLLAIGFLIAGSTTTAGDAPAKRKIKVSFSVPDTAWRVRIDEVHQVKNELWVISTVYRHADVGAAMISTVNDTVELKAPDLPVKHFVLGKTWNWGDGKKHTFIDNRKAIEKALRSGKLLHRKRKR